MMEVRNIGMMEVWNIGMMGFGKMERWFDVEKRYDKDFKNGSDP